MSDEWGPWIEHDGKGCPVRGEVVTCVWLTHHGETDRPPDESTVWVVPGHAGSDPMNSSWIWTLEHGHPVCAGNCFPLVRYRIRKPRGMSILEEQLRNLPQEISA